MKILKPNKILVVLTFFIACSLQTIAQVIGETVETITTGTVAKSEIFVDTNSFLDTSSLGFDFPAAGWHRGDVSVAQENSEKAIVAALESKSPHLEVDIIDFIDKNRGRVGLLAHDTQMMRTTGKSGSFSEFSELNKLPLNKKNQNLPSAQFISVVQLFDIIKGKVEQGIEPIISLDLKEDGEASDEFGEWVGNLIIEYGFQKIVFASSFYKDNIEGINVTCPECLTGGLVFNDHFALQFLNYQNTSLDILGCHWTFFLGFLCKEYFKHDFVLIQDDIYLKNPELLEFWKVQRKVSFVGVFVYMKDRTYTEKEWELLEKVDWLELDPIQMNNFIE